MQLQVNRYWQRWKEKRRQVRLETLWNRHQQILNQGLRLRGRVADVYHSHTLDDYYRLVRVKLELDIRNDTRVTVMSKLLLVTDPSFLLGRQISFKFIAGDLSQIAVVA